MLTALRPAIEAATDSLRWFARATELRLLQIVVSEQVASTVLELAASLQHRDEDGPFACFVLDEPFASDAAGWEERIEALRQDFEHWRVAEDGQPIVAGLDAPPASSLQPLARFAAQLATITTRASQVHYSTLVILAPAWVDDAAAWADALQTLMDAVGLERVRWIVLDPGSPVIDDVVQKLGPAADVCRATVDPNDFARDMASIAEAAAHASPTAPALAQRGAAWPRGIDPPQRRPVAPVSESSTARRAATIALLQACAAAGRQDWVRAVELQRAARDAYASATMAHEAAVMEVLLGTYAMAAQQPVQAAQVFRDASVRALAADAPLVAAQACLALGALALAHRHPGDAVHSYTEAARHAITAGQPMLAIEALRLAGTAALDAQQPRAALDAWTQAVRLADAMPAEEVSASTASMVAWALASYFREQGWVDQALAVEHRATQWEAATRAVLDGVNDTTDARS